MSIRALLRGALAAVIVAFAMTTAAAASLQVGSGHLGAGAAAVARCDTTGVTVTYTGAPGPVTALAVSGLDAACLDGRAFATVTAADGSNPTSGTAIVTGSSISITLSTSRAPETVGAWSLVVLGP